MATSRPSRPAKSTPECIAPGAVVSRTTAARIREADEVMAFADRLVVELMIERDFATAAWLAGEVERYHPVQVRKWEWASIRHAIGVVMPTAQYVRATASTTSGAGNVTIWVA